MIENMSMLLIDLCSGSCDDRGQTLLLASGLLARGEACLLACPGASDLAEAAADRNIPVVPLPGDKPGLGVFLALRRIAREQSITLAHALDNAALLPGAFLRRRSGVPLVHSLRPFSGKRPKLVGWAFRQVDAFVDLGAGLAACSCGSDEVNVSRVKIIPPAVPTDEAEVCLVHRDRRDGRFIFVAAGALEPDKDWHSLLQAVAYLQNMAIDLPPWEVRVVGSGPLFQELLDTAEKLGVLDRLSFLGTQNRRVFLPDADAVIMASSSGPGDVPLILDAWTCGLPVACTALPAHQAVGEEKVSLLLSPPGNSVALAGSMLRLMQEPDLRAHLVQGGERAVGNFRASGMAEAHALLYEGVRNRAALVRADAV